MAIRYDVRVLNKDGKLVTKKRFKAKDAAVNFAADKLVRRRQVKIRRREVFALETFSNTTWGPAPHDPWTPAPRPVKTVFIHHSVTQQLPVSASVDQEKAQMKLLDQIAHGRGFNGISYCWAVMPSARCWEGRGFGIIEAATENFNTSADSIVLAGNYSSFAMNDEQKQAIIALIKRGQRDGFFITRGLDVRAHREVSATSCPGSKISDALIQEIQKAVNA